MRVSSVILALVAGSAMAAPTAPHTQRRSIPQIASSLLSSLSHGASSISSRLTILIPTSHADVVEDDVEEDEEYYGSYEEDILAWEDRHQQCAEVCRVRNIDGARNGKEALCSPDGLESTLACAQCIDITWPEDMYENSAMSEYNRLALTCEEPSANGQFAI